MILHITRNKHLYFLFCFMVSLLVLTNYCGGAKQDKPRENITCEELKSIKTGMTPDQVQAILGPPGGQDIKVGVVHWTYFTPNGTWIIKFRDAKVVDSTSLMGSC